MSLRPLFSYRVIFTHANGQRLEIPAVDVSPCKAKTKALTYHANLLKAEPTFPQDHWRMAGVFTIAQVGMINQ